MVISSVLEPGRSAWVRLHMKSGTNISGSENASFADSLLITKEHPEAQTTFMNTLKSCFRTC